MEKLLRAVIVLCAAIIVCASANATESASEANAEAGSSAGSSAVKQAIQNTTFGGYVIGKASANNQEGATHSNFELRLVRL